MVGIKIKRVDEQQLRLAEALDRLKDLKNQQASVVKAVFEQESLVVDLMDMMGQKSFSRNNMRATVVKSETAVVNEVGLAKALGAKTWNKITKKVLDKSKLEKALADGEIDVNVVSQHTEMRPRKPFVRISEVSAQESQLDETQSA